MVLHREGNAASARVHNTLGMHTTVSVVTCYEFNLNVCCDSVRLHVYGDSAATAGSPTTDNLQTTVVYISDTFMTDYLC